MYIRPPEYAFEHASDKTAEAALLHGEGKIERLHSELADAMEEKLDYFAPLIRELIKIRLEYGLKAAQLIYDR